MKVVGVAFKFLKFSPVAPSHLRVTQLFLRVPEGVGVPWDGSH